MHESKFSRSILKCATALTLVAAALGAHASAENRGGREGYADLPSIAEERFRGEVAMEGLRELGYKVQEPKETEYGVMMVAWPTAMPTSPCTCGTNCTTSFTSRPVVTM